MTAMAFNDLLADRQANAGTFIGTLAVQAFEDLEDSILILSIYANTIVLHREAPHAVFSFCRNMDVRPGLASKLYAVTNQVL